MPTFTNGHALLIGVASYADPAWNAPVAALEAQGVADMLKDPGCAGYPSNQVTLVPDGGATKVGVIRAFEELARRTDRTSTVFILLCAHGAPDMHDVYHFATNDALFDGQKIRTGSGLSRDVLLQLLRNITAQKLLLVLDTCFSGAFGPSLGAPIEATLGMHVLATGQGRAVITASRSTQPSYFQENANATYFGKALINGLRGAAARQGQVGLYDLYQYIYDELEQTSVPQEPVLTITEGVGRFPLALAPGEGGSLGPPLDYPPAHTAVDVYPNSIITVSGTGGQAVQAGGDVNMSKIIDFGSSQIGNVTIRDIAQGDMHKTETHHHYHGTGATMSLPSLIPALEQAKQTAQSLTGLPPRVRRNVTNQLESAIEACQQDDQAWLTDELKKAVDELRPHTNDTTARQLSETIQRLLARITGQEPQPGRSHSMNISDNANVGVAVSGDVHGNIQTGGINYGSGNTINQQGDVVHGDKVGGDKVLGDKHVYQNQSSNQGAQGVFHGPVTIHNNPTPSQRSTPPTSGNVTKLTEMRRRLNALEIRAARSGYGTDPAIEMEIEDLKREIAALEGQ